MKGFNPREFFELGGKRHVADHPEFYIHDNYDLDSDTLHKSIEDAGLSYLVLTKEDMVERYAPARENWIFVYDQKDLQRFLDKNKQALLRAEWPTRADDFVSYLSYVCAPANSEIFDLIHDCYGGDCRHGDNGWLRCNSKTIPEHSILGQRQCAELSRQRFKAFRQNDPEAAHWFLKIAMTGHATAMEDVSRMYEKGQGLKQDMVEAAFWRRLIEINFPSEESSHLPNIFARSASPDYQLTKEQNAEIKKRVEAWRPVGDPCNSVPVPPVPSDEPSRLSFSGLKKILHLSR